MRLLQQQQLFCIFNFIIFDIESDALNDPHRYFHIYSRRAEFVGPVLDIMFEGRVGFVYCLSRMRWAVKQTNVLFSAVYTASTSAPWSNFAFINSTFMFTLIDFPRRHQLYYSYSRDIFIYILFAHWCLIYSFALHNSTKKHHCWL